MANQPPVTQISQGDTCKGCPWIIRGAEQQTKGVFDWGCKFYHKNIGYSKPYPVRLRHCDIDGRISSAKYQKRHQNTTEPTTETTEETQ